MCLYNFALGVEYLSYIAILAKKKGIMIVSLSVYAVMEAHTVSIYIARNYVLFLLGMYWTDIIDERKWKGLGNNRINEKI